jgi:hypothetical protein
MYFNGQLGQTGHRPSQVYPDYECCERVDCNAAWHLCKLVLDYECRSGSSYSEIRIVIKLARHLDGRHHCHELLLTH